MTQPSASPAPTPAPEGAATGLRLYDTATRTVTPVDAATTDFAEGTRLVRVVPDVPAGLPQAPPPRRTIAAVPLDEPWTPAPEPESARDDKVRNVVPVDGNPVDVLLSGDDGPEHDTVVFDRVDPEAEDPRAAIPAWEDIVFGVRRHR